MILLIFLMSMCVSLTSTAQEMVTIQTAQTQQMPICLMVLQDNETINILAQELKKHLELSEQFQVTVMHNEQPKSKQFLTGLCKQGYGLVVFIEMNNAGDIIWRLYDATQVQMIRGGRLPSENAHAHYLAHYLWPLITGQPGPFTTKIAFIKKEQRAGKWRHAVCMANYDGSDVQELTSSARTYIAPAWNNNCRAPVILFSEFTPHNVRLMATNLTGRKKVVLDFDGTQVGVSYTAKNADVVYCHSGNLWLFHYDPVTKQKQRTCVVHEDEPAACPCFLSNGDIMYCCQGKIKQWHAATHQSDVITPEGYCVSPAVHEASGLLLYSRTTKGIMQLWLYDMHKKTHKQLTFGKGTKIDASWSPCGNYIVYCLQEGKHSQLVVHTLKTGKEHIITSAQEHCYYPAWSPFSIF